MKFTLENFKGLMALVLEETEKSFDKLSYEEKEDFVNHFGKIIKKQITDGWLPPTCDPDFEEVKQGTQAPMADQNMWKISYHPSDATHTASSTSFVEWNAYVKAETEKATQSDPFIDSIAAITTTTGDDDDE